jgi:hypothetical protein
LAEQVGAGGSIGGSVGQAQFGYVPVLIDSSGQMMSLQLG